jgi:cytochrome c2
MSGQRLVILVGFLITAGVEVWYCHEGLAVPAFGRKYRLTCGDCHVGASSKLNDFGQLFRDQGYQLPPDHGKVFSELKKGPTSPKTVFERYCETCHGVKGKGDGPMGEVLMPPAPDLTSRHVREKSDAELLQAIQNGSADTRMPSFKRYLTELQLQDMVAYIRSLSQ